MKLKWTKENLQLSVSNSLNKLQTLEKMGLKPFTGNYGTLSKYLKLYNIDISHFRMDHNNHNLKRIPKISLDEILDENSTYSRTHLKRRLYKEGLKERICEKCGQGEEWNGEHMSLILDHINGVGDDNRINNLRIVCPNCNATLDTHCGKNKHNKVEEKHCVECGNKIHRTNKSGYCYLCSRVSKKEVNHCECGAVISKRAKKCITCSSIEKGYEQRKVERPTLEQLLIDVKELGYSGTGRKYNVSDNSIRKWIKKYKE